MGRCTSFSAARRAGLLLLIAAVAMSTLGAEESVASLKERIIDLQNASPLGFRDLALSSVEPAYGWYVPIASSSVVEGSVVYLYIEPDNLFTVRENGRYYVEFVQDLVLVDDAGSVYIDAPNLVEFYHESVSPVVDIYADNRIDLQNLPPGEYRFIVTLRDRMGGDSVVGEVTLQVTPR